MRRTRGSEVLLRCSSQNGITFCFESTGRPIQTAKLHGLDPYAYLRDVLERLPLTPHSRIGELLPGAWKLSRQTTH